jgi:hypothetical protein
MAPGAEVVVTLDCDATYPAAEIPVIADMILSSAIW